MASLRGSPQGAGQSIHAGNMNALPAVVRINRDYGRFKSRILGSVQLVWVDDVFAHTISPARGLAFRGAIAEHPMQGVMVDTLTYDQAVHGIANPLLKMQWFSSDPSVTIIQPTKERLQERVGQYWSTDRKKKKNSLWRA